MAEMSLFLTSHISAALFNGGFHHRMIYYLLPGKSTLDAGYKKNIKNETSLCIARKKKVAKQTLLLSLKKIEKDLNLLLGSKKASF